MTSTRIIVAKIGGSLLKQPDFVVRLKEWSRRKVSQSPPPHIVFVMGGGPLVDGLRIVDRANPMSTEYSHWLAVRLMDMNAETLSHWWPELTVCSTLAEVRPRLKQSALTLLLVEDFLRLEEPVLPGRQLPQGWDVTSDSISARLADVLRADQLILFKSQPMPPKLNWHQAAQDGLVDRHFPTLTSAIPKIEFCCLSEPVESS